MDQAVEIRDARPADAIEVAALHIRSWRVAYRGLLPDEFLDALRAEERAQRYAFGREDARAPRTILALRAGVIRGFATHGPSRDEDARGLGELYALYVDPDAWGGGLGRLLLRRAHELLRASGYEHAILWVLVGNERAARFYRAAGWREDG